MSMLAEPRRRQKWCLNPRGNLWAKDENKLGQKMLEKFGWKSGDGLGSSRQGITDPIALKANSESKGLGHTGGDHDVWYGHKDNFDEVLANLNSEHSNDTPEQVSSLASVSKKAKKRVHYHKFTKGKDMSGYSQDDLSCILGTKELKSIERLKKSKSCREEGEQLLENEESNQEEGGQIIIQGGSMNDYFQKKMKLLKAKRNVKVEPVTIKEEPIDSDDVLVEKPVDKENKRKEEQMALVDVKDEEEEMTKKSKRKRKGRDIEGEEEVEPKKKSKKNKVDSTEVEEEQEKVEPKKKSKKNKVDSTEVEEEQEKVEPKKKSKKNKVDSTEVEEEQEKKSKKKKTKNVEESDSSSQDSKDSTVEQTKPEKKSKKKKVDSSNSSSQEVVPSSKEEEKLGKKSKKDEKKSSKKSTKRKHDVVDEEEESEADLDLQKLFNSGQAIDEIIGFKGSNLSTIVGYGLKDPPKPQ